VILQSLQLIKQLITAVIIYIYSRYAYNRFTF